MAYYYVDVDQRCDSMEFIAINSAYSEYSPSDASAVVKSLTLNKLNIK